MHLDLGAYLDDDALTLNGIKSKSHPEGKSYKIVSPSALDGLRLQRLIEQGDPLKPDPTMVEDMIAFCRDDDGNEIDFDVKLLGQAHAEMVADGVSGERLQRIIQIVCTYYGVGAEIAQKVVSAVGEAQAVSQDSGESPAPSTPPTPPAQDGSSSSPASTATPAPTRARTSTPSSKRTPQKAAAKPAKKTA